MRQETTLYKTNAVMIGEALKKTINNAMLLNTDDLKREIELAALDHLKGLYPNLERHLVLSVEKSAYQSGGGNYYIIPKNLITGLAFCKAIPSEYIPTPEVLNNEAVAVKGGIFEFKDDCLQFTENPYPIRIDGYIMFEGITASE